MSASSDPPAAAADGAIAVEAQRLVLVLPTTAEYDSRTYRIASAVAARGHEVTVLARSAPGLPADERHPAGYRIRRVPVSAVAGLPLPGQIVGWLERRMARRRAAAGSAVASASVAPGPDPIAETSAGPVGGLRPIRLFRRSLSATRRMAVIALTVRAQTRASRRVDPGGDLYHGMAYMGIPVALALAGRQAGTRVVYDARDIYVDANNLARLPRPIRMILGRLERGWARRAARVVTVNQPYADVMASRWAVEPPLVVMNCAYRTDPPDPPVKRFHERLRLAPETAVVLYQGGFSPHRGIEQLLMAMPALPGSVLVLMGYGIMAPSLERRVREPDLAGRVFVLPAVPPTELLEWVAAADVVAMPIQPSTLNHRLTTPNKLFEALAVGVPTVASDLPGMAAIAVAAGGELCDPTDPASIAASIMRILDGSIEERAARRTRALDAGHGRYSWEEQVATLLTEYGRITGRPW
jgi:glycosyltransferase involved in cell wall biosynthesis